jgi:hypothetical protein
MRYSSISMADPITPDIVEEILKKQAEALDRLVKEAQRIHREVTEHLIKLRHTGDESAPNRKPPKKKR